MESLRELYEMCEHTLRYTDTYPFENRNLNLDEEKCVQYLEEMANKKV